MHITLAEVQEQLQELVREGSMARKAELKALPELLQPYEAIRAINAGVYQQKLWLLACTNQRFLMLDKKLLTGLSVITIAFENIHSLWAEQSVVAGKLTLFVGTREIKIENIGLEKFRSFTLKVNESLVEFKQKREKDAA